ncbi:MAG: TonB-dependent receptor plug domain-containing protein [Candidatus Latescibacteria bacterium]|nr:TonB-dependent receptor plug domain-containing protein [Candidatus Latescibacterota bacterium]
MRHLPARPKGVRIALAVVAATIALLAPAWGQLPQDTVTISGFIRSHSDGERLPNATVGVRSGRREMGTLSNSEGYYALPGMAAGRCVVTVSYVGYRVYRDTLWLVAGRDLRRDIELDRETLEMGEVVVESSSQAVQSELNQQTSIVALKMDNLQQMPAMGEPDLLRSLQLLPGVQTASDFSSGLYVRGGGPDQTGILLDQVRLYNPSHAFGFFSTFNPDAIKDVTFYKGAYPARYGGSLGAVLDVQNRDGNRRQFNSRGGVSLISSRMTVEGPLGQGAWMVAGRRTYIDPVLKAIRGASDNLDGLGYYFYDINGKVNTQLTPEDNLVVSFYGGDDDLTVGVSEGADSLAFDMRWGNRALTGRWTHLFSPRLFGRLIGIYSKYQSDIELDIFDTPIAIRNRLRDATVKGDIDFFASPDHTLRTGVDLTFYRFDYRVRFDQYRDNLAVEPFLLSAYVQDDWQLTPLTEARLGLRGAYYEEGQRLALNPRFSLSHLLQDGWRVKLAGGRYQQFLQLVSTEGFSGADSWVPLDETVEPGRSWQIVGGLEWDPVSTYKVSLESYYTDLANLVVLDQEAEENREQITSEEVFKTGGQGWAAGLELFVEKRRGGLTGWLGYTLGWTRRQFAEIDAGRSYPPKYDRRHDISLTATYRFAPVCSSCGRWIVTANFVYGSGQAFTPAAARYTLRDPAVDQPVDRLLAARRNSARLLPYHRLDLGVRRTLKLFGDGVDAEVYLQIFNFYNRRNEWFIQYDGENAGEKPEVVEMFPVLPTFGLDFRF